MGRSPLLQHIAFPRRLLIPASVWGISCRFQQLSPSEGQVSHVLLTRPPLSTQSKPGFAFDLHVLGTPPAFILSQDQTLRLCLASSSSALKADVKVACLVLALLLASCHYAVVKVP